MTNPAKMYLKPGIHAYQGQSWPVVILLLSAVVVFPSTALAATYEVYTYGNGDFLAAIFNGVAMFFNSGSILYGLIKIAAIVLVLTMVISSVSGAFSKGQMNHGAGLMPLFAVPLILAFVIYVVMTPKATLAIIDRQDPGQSQVISNVPLLHTYMAHVMSTIGDKVGEEFETVFGQPDGLKFRNGGVGIGAKYTGGMMSIYPPDSSMVGADAGTTLVTQVLREYFVRCVFPNFAGLDGESGNVTKALNNLFTSENVPADLKSSTVFNNVNLVMIGITTPEANCQEAIDQVYAKWDGAYNAWLKDIETKLAGGVGSAGLAGNTSITLGGGTLTDTVVTRYFPNSSVTTKEMLMHIATLNLMRDSVTSYLVANGVPSDSAYSISQKGQAAGWLTAAKMLNTIVHTMRNLIEGLAYGLSVLLPVFFLTGSLSPLFSFAKILLWLQLWVPFYVLLNLFADLEYARAMETIFTTEIGKGPTFRTYDLIARQTELTLGYVGAVAWSVPTFAWGLVSMGSAAISGVASSMSSGAGAQATASSTGGEVAGKGNVSLNTRSFASDTFGASSIQTSQHGFDRNMQNFLGTKDSEVGLRGLRKTAEISAGTGYGDALGTEKVAQQSGKDVAGLANDLTTRTKTAANETIDRVGGAEKTGAIEGAKTADGNIGYDKAMDSIGGGDNEAGHLSMQKDISARTATGVLDLKRAAFAAGVPDSIEGRKELAMAAAPHGVASENIANALNKSSGGNAYKAGMRLEGLSGSPDGKLMVKSASMQNQDGSTTTVSGGLVTHEGTHTAAGALAKAAELRKNGHGDAADGLERMVSQKDGGKAPKGRGITGDESIGFRQTTSLDGKNANYFANHGAGTEWNNLGKETKGYDRNDNRIDLETEDKGKRSTKGDKIWTGRSEVNEDTRKDITNHGPELNNAMYMAQYGDSAYAKYLTSAKSPKEFDANLAMTVDSTLNDVRDFVTKKGLSAGFAEGTAGASAGFKFFGVGADAKGTVGKASREEQAYDLMRSDLMRELRSARIEAAKSGMNNEETKKHITDKAGDFLHKNIFEPAEKATSNQFGANAPVTALKGDDGRKHMEVTDDMIKKNPGLANLKKE